MNELPAGVYDLRVVSIDGGPQKMDACRGKTPLVACAASRSGCTRGSRISGHFALPLIFRH